MNVPGGQVGQSPLALVFVLDAHGAAATGGGLGGMATGAGLDGGLLVGGDDVLSFSERFTLPPAFVEVQDPSRFLGELRSSRGKIHKR